MCPSNINTERLAGINTNLYCKCSLIRTYDKTNAGEGHRRKFQRGRPAGVVGEGRIPHNINIEESLHPVVDRKKAIYFFSFSVFQFTLGRACNVFFGSKMQLATPLNTFLSKSIWHVVKYYTVHFLIRYSDMRNIFLTRGVVTCLVMGEQKNCVSPLWGDTQFVVPTQRGRKYEGLVTFFCKNHVYMPTL